MTYTSSKLQGRLIWLTGASSGIGESLAYECAKRGAKVILSARRVDLLKIISDKINDTGGISFVHPVDIEDLEAVKTLVRTVEADHGTIDILLANAGTHIFTKPEEFDSKEYLHLMNLNYGGMLHCIEAVLPSMLKNRYGHIVGMGSLAGIRGVPKAGAYGASKAAINHFLESIRFHLKHYNISVSVVNPGFVKTPLTDKNDFYMPFLINGEKAARIICNGIEAKKRDISFPFPFDLIVKLGRFLPAPLYERMIDRMW